MNFGREVMRLRCLFDTEQSFIKKRPLEEGGHSLAEGVVLLAGIPECVEDLSLLADMNPLTLPSLKDVGELRLGVHSERDRVLNFLSSHLVLLFIIIVRR